MDNKMASETMPATGNRRWGDITREMLLRVTANPDRFDPGSTLDSTTAAFMALWGGIPLVLYVSWEEGWERPKAWMIVPVSGETRLGCVWVDLDPDDVLCYPIDVESRPMPWHRHRDLPHDSMDWLAGDGEWRVMQASEISPARASSKDIASDGDWRATAAFAAKHGYCVRLYRDRICVWDSRDGGEP